MKYILIILAVCFLASGCKADPDPEKKYRFYIAGGNHHYNVNEYTEKDGCVLFDGVKICGSYTIDTNN